MKWGEFVAELSHPQIKAISEISRDIGQVCLASVVIPFLVPQFSPDRVAAIIVGLSIAFGAWIMSIHLVKNIYD
ncbi:MAG: hypothetical protein AAB524_02155 [Patescibacteria group bacterium]